MPDRNVERMLRNTHVPVPSDDQRRLDLVVPGLNVARGLPLFCDITVLAPLSRNGQPRAGTSNRGGRILEEANNSNATTYHEVVETGLGALYCLGCEVYGRWGQPCVELVPALAREHARGMYPHTRRGAALGFQTRWWSLLSVALMPFCDQQEQICRPQLWHQCRISLTFRWRSGTLVNDAMFLAI